MTTYIRVFVPVSISVTELVHMYVCVRVCAYTYNFKTVNSCPCFFSPPECFPLSELIWSYPYLIDSRYLKFGHHLCPDVVLNDRGDKQRPPSNGLVLIDQEREKRKVYLLARA